MNDCKHLIIDAGHIAIESDLVAKEAIRTIHQKRNTKYTDEDYKNLESLMYDKMSLRLEDAQVFISLYTAILFWPFQFIIGNNLEACKAALTSKTDDSLHVLERLTINLRIDKSIVPNAINLAQFKVSGTLPTLQVNLSDTKYKSLMRLIDVCIPHFEESVQPTIQQSTPSLDKNANTFHLSTSLFGSSGAEYNIEDEEDSPEDAADEVSSLQEDQFYEADDGSSQVGPLILPSVCLCSYLFKASRMETTYVRDRFQSW